jgi:UDP-N-acetylmuramate--alanine ligase
LFDDFLGAFDDTDVLYLMEVYAAGEDPIPEVSARRLYEGLRARGHLNVHYFANESEAALRLMCETAAGDLLITLGAGDVYKLGDNLLAQFAETPKADECA